jgi:Skp family chaperone for outer membrane proteins
MTPMTSVEPALENGYTDRNSQPGDSPMMRNWKMLAFQTLLAGTLIPAGAQAQAPASGSDAPPKPPDTASILKEIQELKKTLSAMDTKVASSFRAMQEEADKRLKKLEDDGVAAGLRLEKTQADIEDMKKQLLQLRQDLDVVRNRAGSSRESGYTPPANAPTAATGRVRLVNTFLDPMTIIVNGVRYQLAPGETRLTEPVPAGTFNYEVLGVQPRLDRTLAANETFTITVYPR